MTTVAADQKSPLRADWIDRIRAMFGRSKSRSPRITDTERALIAAQGKALTMLATTLQARGVMEVQDFASTLAVFSVVVSEDNALEGDILAVWAAIMKESL